MPEPNEVYTPTPGLVNALAAEHAGKEIESTITSPKPAFGAAPDELEDGTPVRHYEHGMAYGRHEVISFKRSQIREMEPSEYQEHRQAIIKAQLGGLVEDDITAKRPDRTDYKPSPMEELRLLQHKSNEAAKNADTLYQALKAAEQLVEREKYADEYDRNAAAQRLADADKAWTKANVDAVAAKAEWDEFRREARKVYATNVG